MWLSGLVVSALGIRARGPGFDSRVVPLFHWVATLGKLFTHVLPSGLFVLLTYLVTVRMKQQLKELKSLQNDAEISRDRAKEELVNMEKRIYADRRARDVDLQNVRRESDEKRQQQELFQRRIVRTTFAVAGARLWNSLPPDVIACDTVPRFRRELKTFLFRQSYPSIVF